MNLLILREKRLSFFNKLFILIIFLDNHSILEFINIHVNVKSEHYHGNASRAASICVNVGLELGSFSTQFLISALIDCGHHSGISGLLF